MYIYMYIYVRSLAGDPPLRCTSFILGSDFSHWPKVLTKLGGQLVARRGVFKSLAFLSGAHTYYARPGKLRHWKLAVREHLQTA